MWAVDPVLCLTPDRLRVRLNCGVAASWDYDAAIPHCGRTTGEETFDGQPGFEPAGYRTRYESSDDRDRDPNDQALPPHVSPRGCSGIAEQCRVEQAARYTGTRHDGSLAGTQAGPHGPRSRSTAGGRASGRVRSQAQSNPAPAPANRPASPVASRGSNRGEQPRSSARADRLP